MTLKTEHGNRAFLPEAVHDLVVQPVSQASIAMLVANTVSVDESANGYRVPVVAADPSVEWVAEGDEITPSTPTLAEVYAPFSKLAGLTIVSKEMAEDTSPAAAEFVGNGLARDLARKIDAAYFGSKGTDPVRPAGLEDLAGVNAITAGASWTNVDPFAEAVYAAEAAGATLAAFVANPADALLMAKVKKATGSNEPLLGNDPSEPTRRVVQGVPLFVSPGVTAGTIWGIPKGRTVVALRRDPKLEIDHSVFFTSDRVAIKATLRAAILFPHAGAVQKVTLTA